MFANVQQSNILPMQVFSQIDGKTIVDLRLLIRNFFTIVICLRNEKPGS